MWIPKAMRVAPELDLAVPMQVPMQVPQPFHLLLLNPFYPKDPHASFGKHVLTPTLALSSIAAAVPSDWTVKIWDENLLQGPPPWQPFPQVVGITAHVVFQPQHMTPQQLADGYARCYRRLFSLKSIWRRRPGDSSAVLPYLAMSMLYKRSNWLWYFLIRYRLTGVVWRPLVEWTRRRHLKFRQRLEAGDLHPECVASSVISAGC